MTKAKKDMKQIFDENHEKVVKMILDKLGEDLSWEKPWKCEFAGAPISGITKKPYTGRNHFNLFVAMFCEEWTDPRWFTRKAIHENGWKIKEGEGSSMIEHWGMRWCLAENDDIVKMGWGEFKGDVPEGMELHKWMAPHHFTNVWNAHQIDGIELLEPPKQDENEKLPIIDQLIESSRCKVHEKPSDRAFYRQSTDDITIPLRSQFEKVDEFASTLAHEMTHSTGNVLNREMGGGFGSAKYAKEELVAEFGAMFTCSELGIDFNHKVDRENNSAAYIKSWLSGLNEDKTDLIYEAAVKAEKASQFIIERYMSLDGNKVAA